VESSESADFIRWSESQSDLPQEPLNGAVIGISHDMLILAGGSADAEGQATINTIYVKPVGEGLWREGGRLPHPLAFSATTAYKEGLLIIGGRDGESTSNDAFLLRWEPQREQVEIERLEIPASDLNCYSATVVGDVVYTVGSVNGKGVFAAMDFSKAPPEREWRELIACPDTSQKPAAMVSQYGAVFLWGRDGKGWRYDTMQQQWTVITELPFADQQVVVIPYGQSHILAAGSVESDRSVQGVYAYHTITDRWMKMKTWTVDHRAYAFVGEGNEIYLLLVRDDNLKIYRGEQAPYEEHFVAMDYATLGGYLLLMVGMGIFFSLRSKSTDDFFLGGRRVPWWVAGISIRATQISSIGFMAIPAKIFSTNMAYFWGLIGTPLACLLVIYFYLPFYRRLKVTTAYEYLEQRFNVESRLMGSLLFILFQLGRISIVMYLPAVALSAVTGIDIFVCIVVAGVLCTIYTVLGGIEAVIWTDLLQAIVLFGGAIFIFVTALVATDGGVGGFFDIAGRYDKFHSIDWTWDMTVTAIWVIVVGEFFMKLVTYSSDQAIVQRYLTTKDEKEAVKSIWANIGFAVFWWTMIFMLGAVLFGFYQTRPELLDPRIRTDAIVPLYVAQRLPAGISGLVIAGIFAATMSTVDSGMHSIATSFITDIYRRFRPGRPDRVYLFWARVVTVMLGLFATGVAVWMAVTDIKSIWDLFMSLLGLLSGGLGGLFALGIFTRRGNGVGGLVGLIASALILYWVKTHTSMHFFLYAGTGFVSCMIIGYMVSLIVPVRKKNLAGLTIYDMGRREDG
jgi:SSS family transporter